MKTSRFASLTVLLIIALTPRPAPAIVGGEVDTDNRFSNVGALIVVSRHGVPEQPFQIASCVLIHPRVVLAAGHTTLSTEMIIGEGVGVVGDARIAFGVDAFDPDGWVEIEAIVSHPSVRLGIDQAAGAVPMTDLGVFILKEPVNLPCATLAHVGLLDELKKAGLLRDGGDPTEFIAAGYGVDLQFPPPEIVGPDGLRRFSSSQFRSLTQGWLMMDQNAAQGNDGTGYGDSGGPRFWTTPDGELILVGITSRGDPLLVSNDIACRIDTDVAADFIDEVIAEVEAEDE